MRTGTRLWQGAAWLYGAQVVTVIAQFAYAAVTSRFVSDDGFGVYAVALSVTGFVTLIASGGLGQSVGRMSSVDTDRLRSLITYAAILGTASAVFTIATAKAWAQLWNAPDAIPLIRWYAITAFLAPISGLATGLTRRIGRFRALSISTILSNITGMAIGLACVSTWRSGLSLIVSPIVAQVLLVILGLMISGLGILKFGHLKEAKEEVLFSWKLTISSILSYGIGNVSRIAVSRVLGAPVIGQWNRADVLTGVPFQQAQTALIQAVYPEFRHDIDNPKHARTAWTDLLVFTSWVFLPLGAIASVILPPLVPLLFGTGWTMAEKMVPILCIAAALQVPSTLLASAVEALGRFRWIWPTQFLLLGLQFASILPVVLLKSYMIAIWTLLATQLLRLAVYVLLCAKNGYVSFPTLLRGTGAAAAFAVLAFMGSKVWLCSVQAALTVSPWWWIPAIALPAIFVVMAWMHGDKWMIVKLSRRYGLR